MGVLSWSWIVIPKSLGLHEQAQKVFCSTATNQNKVFGSIWQRYGRKFGGTFLWTTVYIYTVLNC